MKFHLITSRFRSFTIASTWIVASTVNSIYLSDLLKENGKIKCIADTTSLLYIGLVMRDSLFSSLRQ